MKEVAEALADFTQAQAVIKWLEENGALKENLNPNDLAFNYAIAYSGRRTIQAFLQIAKAEVSHREQSSAKRRRMSEDEKEVESNEIRKRDDEQLREARSLAGHVC